MNSRRDFLGGCFYAHFYFIRIKRPKRAIRMTAIRMMMTAIATSIEIAKIH